MSVDAAVLEEITERLAATLRHHCPQQVTGDYRCFYCDHLVRIPPYHREECPQAVLAAYKETQQ